MIPTAAAAPIRSRGIERAADLVVWGIGRRPIQLMHATKYGEDLETYELLTGRPSPRIAHWDDAAPRQAGVRPNIPPSELPARANLS